MERESFKYEEVEKYPNMVFCNFTIVNPVGTNLGTSAILLGDCGRSDWSTNGACQLLLGSVTFML